MKKFPEDLRILTLMISAYKGKIENKMRLHKIVFLISKNHPELEKFADFEAYYYGPYSESIESALDYLVSNGFLEEINKGKSRKSYIVTPQGKKIADKLIKEFPEVYSEISELYKVIDILTDDELLALVYFSYPEYAKESKIYDKIREKRVELAVSLYQKGVISLGKAAEIAGMGREDFQTHLKNKNIPITVSAI